ncbi:MAG: amidohydrolase family protein [Phycisphaerae bacterium]|nr:amidohydrolase family protein [Phycisphaerae bacterium]
MIIDVHCHLAYSQKHRSDAIERFSFEPLPPRESAQRSVKDTGALPTDFDGCVSPRAANGLLFRLLMRELKVQFGEGPGPGLDERIARVWDEHLLAPGPIDRYVLLAMDAAHDDDGRVAPLPRRAGQLGSDIYVSNSLVRAACRARPDRYLFGASIHPYRPGALEAIDEVVAGGACLMKWLPVHQNIEIRDPRSVAFVRRLGQVGLPLLVHYNVEFLLGNYRDPQISLGPMIEVLRELRREGEMPTVIFAHVATHTLFWGRRAWHDALCHLLLNEFADEPIYADISALGLVSKASLFLRLLERQELHRKLLFGSDFPVPMTPWRFRLALGNRYSRVAGERSAPQMFAKLCRELGFNEGVMTQAAKVLRMGNSE